MTIREAAPDDLRPLLDLYTHLHEASAPPVDEGILEVWQEILADRRHHVLLGEKDGRLVSSCVLVVVPNLTRNQRPYALVENVVTHAEYRGRGYATRILDAAAEIARGDHCYKIMLLTGGGEEIQRFYERAGYNRKDKTAFIRWL